MKIMRTSLYHLLSGSLQQLWGEFYHTKLIKDLSSDVCLPLQGRGPSWHLSHVDVSHTNTGVLWSFPAGCWLAKDKGDGQIEIDLFPAGSEHARVIHKYIITTFTSDIRYKNAMSITIH